MIQTMQALAFDSKVAFLTLLKKEIVRFRKVAFHTIAAPVISSLLYLVVFSAAVGSRVTMPGSTDYLQFLVPGLVMMAVLQNAFANVSSSFVQSKISGTLAFILMPPMTGSLIAGAYILSSVLRGLIVGACVLIATALVAPVDVAHLGWIAVFAAIGSTVMASLGLVAAIWADRYEEMGVIQNFFIMPLTFLAGVFYSTESLPGIWQDIARINPLFYLIDGFRGGFIGHFESDPRVSLLVAVPFAAACVLFCAYLINKGYKIRS